MKLAGYNDLEIIKVENIENLNECLKIRNEVFIKEKNVPKEIEVDEYDYLNNKCDHFIIEYEKKKIGTLRCLNVDSNIIKIQRFCFLKEYRKLGLGKATLNYIENYYRQKNKKKIIMDAKYGVYKFYEKCGYEKNSDVFIEANIEHIRMIKNI